ncbi:hypothetical protein ACTNDY_06440 [Tissierellaceae bacterium HCP3S3_D8]
MKKTLSIFLVCVALLIFANGVFATNLNSKIIPYRMKPGTLIIYDKNLEPEIIKGGYTDNSYIKLMSEVAKKPILSKVVDNMNEEEIKQVELENRIVMDAYENGIYIEIPELEIVEGMKVEYDENTGDINNVYYRDDMEPSGYSISNGPPIEGTFNKDIRRAINERRSVTWTWGEDNNTLTYQPLDDSFLGTGTATNFSDEVGNRDNPLGDGDCATKKAYDYSKRGDEDVTVRNLNTDKVFTFYQADVGGMPNAIIDIWGLNNLHDLAGRNDVTSVKNVRYYHKRFSDQSIPR